MKITTSFFRMWRKDASEGGGVWEGPHRLLWGFQELRWIGKSQVKEYLNLRVIGRYFFPQNHWPCLIICIDLFMGFFLEWGGVGCRFSFQKVSGFYKKKNLLWGHKVRLYHQVDPYNNRTIYSFFLKIKTTSSTYMLYRLIIRKLR